MERSESECREPGGVQGGLPLAGPPVCEASDRGRADFIPRFLSDIPRLFLDRAIPIDVALLQLSRPDRHGYCTPGTSGDAARASSELRRSLVETRHFMPPERSPAE